MAPKPRDYKAEYERRQARAREQGFASYYERRVAGVERGRRAEARGHRGQIRSLRQFLNRDGLGATVGVDPGLSIRNALGQWTTVIVQVNTDDGRELTFRLDRPTEGELRRLVTQVEEVGAIDSVRYPLSGMLPGHGVSEVAA